MPIKTLAWIHIVLAALVLAGGVAFFADLLLTWDAVSATDMAWTGPPFAFFAVTILLPELLGGIGLLRHRDWGRVIILILSGIYLLMFPVGTLLGGFGLWALLGREGRAAFGKN